MPVNRSAAMFYLWALARFGHNKWFTIRQCTEFQSKRNIYRHLKKLEKIGMIERKYINRQNKIRIP